ncbi:MAG: YigZ family protein [Bacteroidales bacterium 36-12]|nr:MAG: YigZ family protein [Bacteroidales bacterium 36-12]
MSQSFLTIQTSSSGIYKEKGSKFLSFAMPVSDIEEIKEYIADFKKKYYDARHVCYAYILGNDGSEYRVNDDGEPSGTAGRPIFGQIQSRNLTNVLVVVVRYFGGVLLGTGGLVTAYKEAASDALLQATIIQVDIKSKIKITCDYQFVDIVMSTINNANAEISNKNFTDICELEILVPLANKDYLAGKLENIVKLNIIY